LHLLDAGMPRILFFYFLLSLSSGAVNAEEQQTDTAPDVAVHSDPQELERQKDELLGLLAQVDERYGDVAASLKDIEQQISSATASLDKTRKEISAYQRQIDELDNELAGQIKAAYAMGQQDKLKLMLNQQDPALSSRMMVYYEYLNKSRLEKLGNLRQTVRYLDQLDEAKRKETELLEKSLGRKKAEQAALDEVKQQRNSLVKQLNGDFNSEQDQLSLLKASENKLISLIQTLEHDEAQESQEAEAETETENPEVASQESTKNFPKLTGEFSSLKGKLPLPVRGRIVNMQAGPSTEASWKGVLISAKEGTEIKAVTKGKVAYAGTLKGYGLLIIIEHDSSYMSLYAFNESLYKQKGDNVEAGDVIASVGQSGGRSKPGLYFEIRKNGLPVDPLLWCRN
jgi:septal ring factor EnvC (AmiA/AmiB activator)